MNYGNPSYRKSADVPLTVFTSVLTSTIVTVGILYFTGNLLPETEPAPVKEEDATSEKTVETPSLIGLTTEVAGEVLRARGLRLVVQEERPDSAVSKGKICEQDPLANSELNTGGAVAVVISTGLGQSPIPNVAGKTLEEAKKLLTEAGFKVGDINESDEGTPGTVFATSPDNGTTAKHGATVDITVTKAIKVPKVVGMYISKAKKTLTDAGFKIGRLKWGDTGAYDAHVVLAQDPEPDTVVVPGTEIILTVNSE
jgi:serine/threonine-protein kinase